MGHHNNLYDHNKHLDALERYLDDVIYPVVMSQESMVNNPVAGITRKNQSMLVETYRGGALHPNGLLTHSDTTQFCISKSLFHLPSKWRHRILTITELA